MFTVIGVHNEKVVRNFYLIRKGRRHLLPLIMGNLT